MSKTAAELRKKLLLRADEVIDRVNAVALGEEPAPEEGELALLVQAHRAATALKVDDDPVRLAEKSADLGEDLARLRRQGKLSLAQLAALQRAIKEARSLQELDDLEQNVARLKRMAGLLS